MNKQFMIVDKDESFRTTPYYTGSAAEVVKEWNYTAQTTARLNRLIIDEDGNYCHVTHDGQNIERVIY